MTPKPTGAATMRAAARPVEERDRWGQPATMRAAARPVEERDRWGQPVTMRAAARPVEERDRWGQPVTMRAAARPVEERDRSGQSGGYAETVTQRPPTTVRAAGAIVAAQGAVGLVVAAVLLFRAIGGADERVANGFGTAVWFALAGGAVAAAGGALLTGKRWGRGLAVFAELLLLPVSYYLATGSHRASIGIPVGLVALTGLVLLFTPAALRWVASSDQSGPASSASSAPDSR